MLTNRRKRPIIAVVLALVYPGLGHLYLREWLRSLLWFGLVVTSSTLVIPESMIPTTLSVDALVAASQQLPGSALAVVFGVTVLSMLDAYWLATGGTESRRTGGEGAETCPSCGKELDEDLAFCHWCTAELSDGEQA